MWEDEDDDEGLEGDDGERNFESLPIYRKALDILDLTEQIVDTFGEEEGMAKMHRESMLEDAMILPAKIAGAEAMDYYVHKMENATVVKIHARSLLTQTTSIKYLGLVNEQYVQLLRDEIDAFRLLFKAWVKTFDSNTTKEGDGWGLFVSDDE